MKRLLTIALSACACAGTVTQADDTEVFVTETSTAGSTAQPNVLFVFDTSGSMDWTVTTKEDYDPLRAYGTSSGDYYYFYDQDYDFVRSVHSDYVNCEALHDTIADQPSNPVFNGRVAFWYEKLWWEWQLTDGWNDFTSTSGIGVANPVECAADGGIHGAAESDPDTYAADDANGPYSSNASYEIDWANRHQLIAVSANYHDYIQDPNLDITRRKTDIMKDAAKDLVDDFDGLNFGMMRFRSDSEGGYVVNHFEDITPTANKTTIKAQIDTLPASGGTPLTETLWEAARYLRGDTVDYGGASVAAALSGGSYNSPMTHSCQQNHLVYLTDGEPYSDSGRDSAISTLTGHTCSHTDGATLASQTCFDELAGWMNETDHSNLAGDQAITLHTIGFDIDLDLLTVAAAEGGGGVYNASNATELKAAFNSIISNILSTGSTFAAPAVTVNAYNNLRHRDELYYALFEPTAQPGWPGNIKRYRITSDAVIVDQNGNNAISETTGFFHENARSYWSSVSDGFEVTEGGFVRQLGLSRNLLTYTGADAPDNEPLTHADNEFATANPLVSNTLLGLDAAATTEERDLLMRWMRGEDVGATSPTPHQFVADPLHGRPVVVTYGGTSAAPDDTVYAANNLGMLHAIDADDGSEVFTFIPQELLPNGRKYLENNAAENTKLYGLDGAITIWRDENPLDTDVTIEPTEGDRVYLYVGMRRGGGHYYAVDVTDRGDPRLLWQIDGGSGDFLDLSQTWSTPKLANVKWGCTSAGNDCDDKVVLLFGGGYDIKHDNVTATTSDDGGAAVFMVDAVSGELLWSAGRPATPTAVHDLELDMANSMPADMTLVDVDNDGFMDAMFGVDIGGNVWRFDINDAPTNGGDFATGGRIATLGDYDADTGNDAENFRRFYYAPDVAFFAPRGGRAFFSISMTSGYRAHPKDTTVDDRVYTLFDPNVFDPPMNSAGDVDYTVLDASDTEPLDEGDLFDATFTAANRHTTAPHGWYKSLQGASEKGLARTTTFAGALVFTTYLPSGGASVCGSNIGSGRVYVLDVLTGSGRINEASGGALSEFVELVHVGIPPAPVVIYTDASETYTDSEGNEQTNTQTKPILCVGTECFGDLLPTGDPLSRTFWRENE